MDTKENTTIAKELSDMRCVPCRRGVPPLKGEALAVWVAWMDHWNVVEEHHIEKTYHFKDFRAALDFVNAVGQIAEEQEHHPEITLGWGMAAIRIWTHKIDGLSENDFILAAKIDRAAAGV